MNEDNLDGMLAVLAGMIIFKASDYIGAIEQYMKQYPLIFVGLGFLLFFQRKNIIKRFKKKSNA